jgi:tRNA pseudouridine38-40 synthase
MQILAAPGSLTVIACRKLSITHSHSPLRWLPLESNLLSKGIPVTELAQPAPELQTWKLTLAYDGTDFSGWQVQPGEATIQGELQAALRRVTGESPLPQGSGRTDAGVHALAQVASFALRAPIPAGNLQGALNRTLPASIRILEAKTVPNAFHARHSAVAKTYEYRVFRGEICPPFLARYVFACPWPMDFEALQKSAQFFVGEHDFLSFAATDPDLASRNGDASTELDQKMKGPPATAPVRTIFSSAWEERRTEAGDLLVYRVRGNGFLHHMVRNLVGTMLDVGRGHLELSEIPAIIAARSRSAAGPTAPARGLFLHSVEYPASED